MVGLDNFDPFYDRSFKEEALSELRARDGFSFVGGDIRDRTAVMRALDGVDIVLHLAARVGVRPSIADPEPYSSINVQGTVTLLEACRASSVRRFVFGSSSSVYGDTTPAPFREDAPAMDPRSPYAVTKRAGELIAGVYGRLFGMRIACLRFFTVYGARQRPDLAIHRFSRLLLSGRPLPQYGDGSSERDYTHIDDIVQGVGGAVEWVLEPEPAFEIFNLGESRTVSLRRLIDLLGSEFGVEPQIEVLPAQPGDVRRTHADIQKARRVLGYEPTVSIESGIARFVKWFEAYYERESRTAA